MTAGGFTIDPAAAYDEHVWDVYGYLAYRLGSRADAEDLTQQTFERALRRWSTFDASRGSMRTWLLAIAHNALIDHFRRRGSMPVDLDALDEAQLPAAPPVEPDLGVAPELAAAIGTLGLREREILALRFGADMTGPEIAELLGLTLANVQQILSRSLRRLRATLEGASEAQPAGPRPS